ncbi:Homeobox protein unc-4 [Escovopsis weberi]|uniref:Homeobox protein unc-4 n=1 Tax=Escovopsis weberi TaxID=150374 RepID=A0A0M8N339_ESCWE|nr:Homeobox protein unc-4 [Escovopsis weberi]
MLNHHQAIDQLPDFALNEELGGLALQQQPSPQQFNQLPVYTTQPPYSQRQAPRSRFSREEQEFLEAEYQKDHKPTTAVKRSLALRLGVETPRINNWFQNRRAREKKDAIVQNYQAKLQRESEEAERDRALLASSAPFPDQSMTSSSSTRHGSPLDYSAEELTPESCADVSQASSSPLGSPHGLPASSSLDYIGFESSPSVRTCDDDDSPIRPQLRVQSRRSYRFNPLAAVPRGVPLVASHSFEGISSMGMLEESMSVPMDRRMTVPGYGKMEMHTPEGFKLDSPWMGADSYGQM